MSDGVAVREERKHLGFLPDVARHGVEASLIEEKQGGGAGKPRALEMQAQRTSWSRENGMAVRRSQMLH